jgi:transposase
LLSAAATILFAPNEDD